MVDSEIKVNNGGIGSETIDVINHIVDEIQEDPKYKTVSREKIVISVRHIAVYLVECGLELSIPLSTPTIRLFKNLYETWFGK